MPDTRDKTRRRRKWRITIYNRGKETILAEIPTTHTTENKVQALLQMLYAKMALTDAEIVQSHLRRNVRGYCDNMLLRLFRSKDPISFHVGEGSIYTHAIVVRPEDSNYDLDDEMIQRH